MGRDALWPALYFCQLVRPPQTPANQRTPPLQQPDSHVRLSLPARMVVLLIDVEHLEGETRRIAHRVARFDGEPSGLET